jgi:hypothetical protein
VLLVVGLLRMFLFEKGGVYYLHSGPFLTKLALFALLGLLSIGPTRRFLAMRGALREGRAPSLKGASGLPVDPDNRAGRGRSDPALRRARCRWHRCFLRAPGARCSPQSPTPAVALAPRPFSRAVLRQYIDIAI